MEIFRAILGTGSVMVPPHVFEVSQTTLRYARFEHQKSSLEGRFFRQVELPEDVFQSGALGGPLRHVEVFENALRDLLSELDPRVEKASLLMPDSWLRTVVIEVEETPRGKLEEILRWKLKKLVPYRVEGLRVRGVEADDEDKKAPTKMLVAFAIEQLVAELENAFRRCGVRVGMVTNRSLAMASALNGEDELRSVILLEADGYSLIFVAANRALMLRHKALEPTHMDAGRESLVRQDLRVTRGFLEREFPLLPLARSLVCGPSATCETWMPMIQECLGAPSVLLNEADLRPTAMSLAEPWHVMAPLLGAAGMEVS